MPLPVTPTGPRPEIGSLVPEPADASQKPAQDLLSRGAPLVTVFVGVPLWWVLGLFQAIFFIAAALMAAHLLRQRTIQVPRAYGLWLLFLVWVLGGIFVLQVDAPSAVPGESVGRYLTFGYRFGWYVVCTIAALYVLNTRRTFSSERVCAAIAWFFVILVGGGLLGVLRPQLAFPSALEFLLPDRLTRQKFVMELIHPNTAQVHDFLGSDGARPSAPFAYTNEWGLAIALTLPFFLLVWWRRRGIWRWAMLVILGVAMVPIISSLNRGLWAAIVAIAVFTAIRSALSGSIRLLAGLSALAMAVGIVILLSPLGEVIQARLDTPHSDEGRTNLSTQAVASAFEGSPVIGFGTTRDVAGNFASIAGGATEECPKCAPPPLGTHGQAWHLTFVTGFGGLILFTVFVGGQFLRGLRSRSSTAPASLACLLVLLVTMPIYDSSGIGLFIGFVSIGLLARDIDFRSANTLTMARLLGPVRRGAGIVLIIAVLGGLTGVLTHYVRGQEVRATQSVLVPVIDLLNIPNARPMTLDSESLLVRSGPVIDAISSATGNQDSHDIENRLSIGAEPNTRVLTISYVDQEASAAAAAVEVAVRTYLDQRATLHQRAQESMTDSRTTRHRLLNETFRTVEDAADHSEGARSPLAWSTLGWLRTQMTAQLSDISPLGRAPDTGHPVSDISIRHSHDGLIVRGASGLTMGTAGGLALAWRLADRRRPVGKAARRGNVLDLPVVLHCTLSSHDPRGYQETSRTVRAFRPLCGIFADPLSPASVAFADSVDDLLDGAVDRSGNRGLLIVSESTHIETMHRLLFRCRRMGVQPVGLIVVAAELDQERKATR